MSKIQTELLIQIIREYRNENINDLPRFTLLYLANEAADEIELLRVALQMACYEIFAYRDPRQTSPQKLVDHFMSEAVRGE